MEEKLNFNEVFKDKDKLQKELNKFMDLTPEEKCEDLYAGFRTLMKNRFSSKRDDRMVLDFVYFRELTQKVRLLSDVGVTTYLQFVLDKINETLHYQFGSDKVSNYMLFAEMVRNIPVAEGDEDKKILLEIKQKMKSFENELVKN